MAEIKIEEKNKNQFKNNKLVWLLVLFLFLIIGVIWLVGKEDNNREPEETEVIEQRISDTSLPSFSWTIESASPA